MHCPIEAFLPGNCGDQPLRLPLIGLLVEFFDEVKTLAGSELSRMKEGVMSSIKFDQEASAEEIRKMTMQWDYAYAPSVKLRSRERAPIQFTLPNSIKSIGEVVFTLLGALTTVAAVALLLGWRPF
jgi:hypothetical protein